MVMRNCDGRVNGKFLIQFQSVWMNFELKEMKEDIGYQN